MIKLYADTALRPQQLLNFSPFSKISKPFFILTLLHLLFVPLLRRQKRTFKTFEFEGSTFITTQKVSFFGDFRTEPRYSSYAIEMWDCTLINIFNNFSPIGEMSNGKIVKHFTNLPN